ncbi:hypothetical protein LguiA_002866 [Lonicera macranthoides]
MVQNCLKASELLQVVSVLTMVADARFCKPLDGNFEAIGSRTKLTGHTQKKKNNEKTCRSKGVKACRDGRSGPSPLGKGARAIARVEHVRNA